MTKCDEDEKFILSEIEGSPLRGTMILVKTKIAKSKINGIGLFAYEFIPKGTVVWRFAQGFDLKISKKKLAELSLPARNQFLKYAYLDKKTNVYILCFDDSRFFNHSENPNCIEKYTKKESDEVNISARDIEKGEELTCDYREFDADFDYKMSH